MSRMAANGAHRAAAACYSSLVNSAAPAAALPKVRLPVAARFASSTSTSSPANTPAATAAAAIPKSRFTTRQTTPSPAAQENNNAAAAAPIASQEEALAELRRLRLAARQSTSSPPPDMETPSSSSSSSSSSTASTTSSALPRARLVTSVADASTPPAPPIDIRETPKYKKAMRQWVSLIVGLPVLFVTSYYLFDRLALGNMPTGLQDYRDKMQEEAERAAEAAAEVERRLQGSGSAQPPSWESAAENSDESGKKA